MRSAERGIVQCFGQLFIATAIRQRGARNIVLQGYEAVDFLRDMPVALTVFRVLVDAEGNPSDLVYTYANEAAELIEGYPCETLVGSSLFSLFPDTDRVLLDVLGATACEGTKQCFTLCESGDRRFVTVQTYQPEPGYCACVLHDVTDRALQETASREERRRLEHEASRDPLTGLHHVRAGRALVEEELAFPRWSDGRAALFMIDIDDFKQVNDEFGHDCGDAVLQRFARLLERSFRSTDIVFRAGGDEFAAFVSDIPCTCVVERICADLVKGVESLAAESVGVSVSIGVSVGRPQLAYEAFYRAADQALYSIKRTGKSSYLVADLDCAFVDELKNPASTTLPAA